MTWCRGWEPLAAFSMRPRSCLARIVGERNSERTRDIQGDKSNVKAISPPDSATGMEPALLHFAMAERTSRETDPWEAQPDLRIVILRRR